MRVKRAGGFTRNVRTRDEVKSWAAGLPEGFILCRDMGHVWRPFRARFNDKLNAYERSLRCGRCATERIQTISLRGEVLTGYYSYAEGYQAPAGSGFIDSDGRSELRLESTLRLLGHDDGK